VSSEINTLPATASKAAQLPADAASIVRQRKSLVKELLKQPNLIPTRVAILGGSTTAEVKNMLELFLLGHGVQASFYESGYNRFSEDVLFENPDLKNFKPDIVFIHTNFQNCWNQQVKSKAAFAAKWIDLNLSGQKSTPILARSLSRTTLTFRI
jgi:predicted enzyme involved in methoxymalonyl-ACP biosynthesis